MEEMIWRVEVAWVAGLAWRAMWVVWGRWRCVQFSRGRPRGEKFSCSDSGAGMMEVTGVVVFSRAWAREVGSSVMPARMIFVKFVGSWKGRREV